MGDIKNYRIFYLTVKMGSINKAAETLFIDRTSAGRRLTQLEHSFGKKLLIRTHEGVELTAAGRTLYNEVKNILSLHDKIREKIKAKETSATIRVASTHALIANYLSFIVPGFLHENPNIKVSLFACDEKVEQISSNFDVCLFPKTKNQPSIIQEELLTMKLGLYCSPAYLDRHGIITDLKELDKHKFIIFGNESDYDLGITAWPLYFGKKESEPLREAIITVNSVDAMLKIAEAGVGIVGISDKIVALNNADLVNIYPSIKKDNVGVYISYFADSNPNSPERKLVEFLKKYENECTDLNTANGILAVQ
jgi:DNA-binding transcriptional LysR family regulator